jgi:outer membrane protein assembly factor BamB
MQAVSGAGAQAPVLATGLAIVAGTTGVSAFDATSGKPVWSTPLTGAAAQAFVGMINNGCAGTQTYGGAMATTLAAAVPSGTLVVTASDGIHVLSLTTGQDQWHGAVMGATNVVHDPVLVGKNVYVVDSGPGGFTAFGPGKLIALTGM